MFFFSLKMCFSAFLPSALFFFLVFSSMFLIITFLLESFHVVFLLGEAELPAGRKGQILLGPRISMLTVSVAVSV